MMQAGPPVSGLAAAIVREPRTYRVPPVRSPPLHSSTICLLSLFDACPESCVAFTTSAVLDGESLNVDTLDDSSLKSIACADMLPSAATAITRRYLVMSTAPVRNGDALVAVAGLATATRCIPS